eukprot:5174433-Ditylum_brightwellii.AAC.1
MLSVVFFHCKTQTLVQSPMQASNIDPDPDRAHEMNPTPKQHIQPLDDNGSQVTTTSNKSILHNYTGITQGPTLYDTDKRMKHITTGKGYLHLKDNNNHICAISCWYTPTLPVTVISSGEIVHPHRK